MQNKLTEEDKQKFIEFLNSVADNATFNFKTKDLCNYFKLLAHMQQVLLPKIDANIMEIKKIVEAPKKESEKKGKK